MEPLAGWTVAVTAGRRADEQVAMLERRGASVLHAPVIRTLPLGPERGLRAATAALVEQPPDVLVATTGIGMRSWLASSWSWGLGDRLLESLNGVTILARGPKAAAVVLGEGLNVAWRAPDETMAGVLAYLGRRRLRGIRVAIQLPGRSLPRFAADLREAGADVVELPVYEWVLPEGRAAVARLIDSMVGGEVDAVTFTCAYAVDNLMQMAGQDRQALSVALGNGTVTVACVGPVTAEAAVRNGARDVVVARPARLGAMVRGLADRFAPRARHLDLAGVEVVVQGARLELGGHEVRLTRRERVLLETLVESGGTVLSKRRLTQVAWDTGVDEHTVEVAVNRLRRKLGPAAAALETTNGRGYRLVSRCA